MTAVNENEQNELAAKLYSCIEELLPQVGIKHFAGDEEGLRFRYNVTGDDTPMSFILRIVPDAGIISLLSPFPFNIKENSLVPVSVALAASNNSILNGSFDLDLKDGSVYFRISNCYGEDLIDADTLGYLVSVASNTVDRYNDRILALNKNIISLDDYLEWIDSMNNGQ